MYRYKISGIFYEGMKWEDFLPVEDDSLCPVTIVVEPKNICVGKEFEITKSSLEWFDAFVCVLNKETAKKVLANINMCSSAEIEITEERKHIAV